MNSIHERRVLSLFTGAGGLDIGLERAGFRTTLCLEVDSDCQATLRLNHPRKWKLSCPGDVNAISDQELLDQAGLRRGDLALLAGGPPCQPFSKSGYWASGDAARMLDPRSNTLHGYLRAVEATLPRVLLFENVGGIAYRGKDEGLKLLLNGIKNINQRTGSQYSASVITIDSADYGVPQRRRRVFVIAERYGQEFSTPLPTHGTEDGLRPFMTAWDAIGDLDARDEVEDLDLRGKWRRLLPTIPEGENYLWHTERGGGEPLFGWRTRYWSFMLKLAKNRPSWTIQAQPGPATGPFHWKNRQLSTRELARLQTFPDGYRFAGGRRSVLRQIGNAVPPAIGELLGREIRRQFFGQFPRRHLTLVRGPLPSTPPPEKITTVPADFLESRGLHAPHPGRGLGPGARRRADRIDA